MQDNLKAKKLLTYDDVVLFHSGNSPEALTDVRTYDPTIITQYLKEDMLEITGDIIFLRDTLSKKLAEANKLLKLKNMGLKVVYGYRHPEVQTRYFLKRRNALRETYPDLNENELDRLTHNFVAIPGVAGHPAAAAVDVTIIDLTTSKELDMGTGIADYTDPLLIQTFDPRISEDAMKNRLLLHDAMVTVGFAPFYGEWWHFSYGDREWAAFYNKKALYGAIEFNDR